MTPTREQLASIEWAVVDAFGQPEICPACYDDRRLGRGHAPDCWLAACLAAPPPEPQAMPPIRVTQAEWVALRDFAQELEHICVEVATIDGDSTARQKMRAQAVRSAVNALSPVGLAAAAPLLPVERGDWVSVEASPGSAWVVTAVDTDHRVSLGGAVGRHRTRDITEIRKANGTVWRRPAPDRSDR